MKQIIQPLKKRLSFCRFHDYLQEQLQQRSFDITRTINEDDATRGQCDYFYKKKTTHLARENITLSVGFFYSPFMVRAIFTGYPPSLKPTRPGGQIINLSWIVLKMSCYESQHGQSRNPFRPLDQQLTICHWMVTTRVTLLFSEEKIPLQKFFIISFLVWFRKRAIYQLLFTLLISEEKVPLQKIFIKSFFVWFRRRAIYQ